MTLSAEVGTGQLADLIKEIEAGNEVVLMQANKPVAKLMPATGQDIAPKTAIKIRSIKGHKVLTPSVRYEELA